MPQASVTEWLNDRCMGRYAQTFTEQSIEISLLPRLTDQDLRELGVTLGDRMKILGWIAEQGKSGTDLPPNSRVPAWGGSADAAAAAERRQVTVVFSDLVDSTGLSRRLDPEDLRALIRAYQETVTKIVRAYDGFVAGFRGDGVLVYFGYPQAHEDDVERAVRAALDLVPAVGAIKAAEPLKTRVGIATGLVVVGDLIGSGDTQERNMVGETPNLASRLLALAEPNSVVIADETRLMLGDFFDVEDLGLRHVKGIEQPVRAWGVMHPRAVESRFEAMHSTALTEFSGREDELQLLLKRWSKAKSGEGQVVLISGEPGIGKSRLTAALMEEIANEPHARLRYFCSPQHTDSAFYPVINHMERMAGFVHGDSAETKLDKLDAMLTSNSATEHDKSLIATLLSLPADRYPPLDYDAAQRRVKTMDALLAQLESLAAHGPVLQILEDAHWIDPTTMEALGRNIERLKSLPVLYVITYRPEFIAPWVGESHVATLNLNRLDDSEALRIVASLAGNKSLARDVVADIVERSDGIPLFLEEMTKAVLEAESEVAARDTVAAAPAPTHSVPASLHSSLMSRLDRLGAAKGIAQIGAAIGRSFSHTLLAAVANDDPETLRIHIDRLIASGLLFRQGQPPDATYLFKHALIRDAAYSMLLRDPRRDLHARILEALETKFPDSAMTQPEVLAHHASEAAQAEKAGWFWGEAGLRSFARSALVEAVAQLTRAQCMIAKCPSTPDSRRRQIQLQMPLTQSVMYTKGYGASETEATATHSLALIEHAKSIGELPPTHLFHNTSLFTLWAVKLVAYNQKEERALAERCLNLGEKSQDSVELMLGHNMLGVSQFYAGDLLEARRHFDTAIELYRPKSHRDLIPLLPVDMRLYTLTYRCRLLFELGYPDLSAADVEAALSEARSMRHPPMLLLTLSHAAWTSIERGDLVAAAKFTDEQHMIADEIGAAFWNSYALLQSAVIYTGTDRPKEAIEYFNAGFAAKNATGATVGEPRHKSFLALAHAALADFDGAKRYICEALAIVKTSGERHSEARILQCAGDIELACDPANSALAQSYYTRAIEVARRQHCRAFELIAALSLARLWRGQGKRQEAYDLLAPVYNWFTEGSEWTYMKQSKTLLDQLSAELRLG